MPDIDKHDSDRTEPDAVDSLHGAIRTVVMQLDKLCENDPDLAHACGVVGRWLQDLSEKSTSRDTTAAQPPEPALPNVERVLSIGGMSVPVSVVDGGTPVPPPPEPPPTDETRPTIPAPTERDIALPTIVARARLKAECCRWAITRRKRMGENVDFEQHIKPRDLELANRAKALPNCYAWPLDPYASLPDDRTLDDAAGCYESLADVMELAERISSEPALAEQYGQEVYELAAECCSALRVILQKPDIVNDADQVEAFNWMKIRAYEERIFISRYMRLDDPASPTEWPRRQAEAARILSVIEGERNRVREIKNLLGKLDYTAKRWGDYDTAEREHQTAKLSEALDRLVELGIRTSDTRIRDPLLAIADDLPESIVTGRAFADALRHADEYAARREVESMPALERQDQPTPEVAKARDLVKGKGAVLVGGQCRPHSREALQRELELRELRWVSTRPHEPLDPLAAEVRRKDIDLVLLAIRWSSHSFEELKQVCDTAGKAYVRLPRGYGVNQVAHEILAQVSDVLERAHPD